MDSLTLIKRPIFTEFSEFKERYGQALSHADGLLGSALAHIRQRDGKHMRPLLTLSETECAAGFFSPSSAVTEPSVPDVSSGGESKSSPATGNGGREALDGKKCRALSPSRQKAPL